MEMLIILWIWLKEELSFYENILPKINLLVPMEKWPQNPEFG